MGRCRSCRPPRATAAGVTVEDAGGQRAGITVALLLGRPKRQSLEALTEALSAADAAYEMAESAFLAAVKPDGDRAALRQASQAVADAAQRWNDIAYKCFHIATGDGRSELNLLTERTEVLLEMWVDVASAYRE